MDSSDLRVFVRDDLIPLSILKDLETNCPDSDINNVDKSVYDNTTKIVSDMGSEWNIPPDESYLKQGLIVKKDTPPIYFTSLEWKKTISDILGVDYKRIDIESWQYRTNIENTNGLWLHTDKDLFGKEFNRSIEVLIYVNNQDWKEEYGGELLLFSNKNNVDDVNRKSINGWQDNKLLTELNKCKVGDVIRTDGIGGSWHSQNEMVDFKLERKVKPLFGRTVILDYRDNYNIHAVSPKINFNRKSVEQWFYYR